MGNKILIEFDKDNYKEFMQTMNEMTVATQECSQAIKEMYAEIDAGKKRYGRLWPVLLFFARMKK